MHRKINQQTRKAFFGKQSFKSGNTQVTYENGASRVHLHGSLIAETQHDGEVSITCAGYYTGVTVARARSVLPYGYNLSRNNGEIVMTVGKEEQARFTPNQTATLTAEREVKIT